MHDVTGHPRSATTLERHGAWVLLVLGFLLLLPGNNVLPLLDRDEPRFARATVEMMQRGEWVVPYFNEAYRFDKPVLTYWLMRGSYALFGINEFGARFHSSAATAILAAVVFLVGRRWFNARAGLLAGFALLTCLQMQIHGRSAVADMPMVLCVCLAMIALWELLQHGTTRAPYPWRWFWLFHGSLGVGFLAKGPIALLVPLLAAVLWRFVLWRQPAPWRNLKLHLGLPLMLAIVGAWGIPALLKTQGLFWQVGMGEHVIERGAKAFNGRFPFPLYYVLTAFVSLFPWSAYMGHVWQQARTERTAVNAYLVAWFLAPVLIFSLYATQLMHYIMPGFPAFFLLLAQAVGQPATRRWIVWLRFAIPMLGSLLPLIVIAALRVFAWPPPVPLTFCLLGAFLLMYGLIIAGDRITIAGCSPLRGLALGAIAAAVMVTGLGLRQLTPSVALAAIGGPETPAAFYRYKEPSLVFYGHRSWKSLQDIAGAKAFLAQPGPRLLVVEDAERPLVGTRGARDFSDEVAQLPTNGCAMTVFEGLNVARGKWVTVRAIHRER